MTVIGLMVGVAVYVSNRLKATRLPALEFDGIEPVWLSIDVGGNSILLGTYYRPPGQLASERDQFSDSGVWPPIASSDHSTVFCRIKFRLEKHPSFKRHVWLYDQAD